MQVWKYSLLLQTPAGTTCVTEVLAGSPRKDVLSKPLLQRLSDWPRHLNLGAQVRAGASYRSLALFCASGWAGIPLPRPVGKLGDSQGDGQLVWDSGWPESPLLPPPWAKASELRLLPYKPVSFYTPSP